MVLAHEEAAARAHDFIGLEHIALAIQRADEELSDRLFDRLGLGAAFVAALETEANSAGSATGGGRGKPPFTPGAKRALELSLREALQLGQNWIGLGHMVLGLVRQGGPDALIEYLPPDAEGIVRRWESDHRVSGERTDPRSALFSRLRPRPGPRPENVAEGFTRVIHAAHDQARGPVGSQHLLLGMFEAGDTLAKRVLESLDVSQEKVIGAIESLGSAGTLDDPPLPEVEIRVQGKSLGTVHIEPIHLIAAIREKDPAAAERLLRFFRSDEAEGPDQ